MTFRCVVYLLVIRPKPSSPELGVKDGLQDMHTTNLESPHQGIENHFHDLLYMVTLKICFKTLYPVKVI